MFSPHKSLFLSVMLLMLCLGSAIVSNADPVTIVNHGFENPPLSDGGFTVNVVPGWVVTGANGGVSNQPTTAFTTEAPEGSNVAYAFSNAAQGTTISQVLNATLQANTLYTLRVEVGNSKTEDFPDFRVELWAGGAFLASYDSPPSPAPTDDTFITATVIFSALPGNMAVGQALEIRLLSLSSSAPNPFAFFDNVRLDATGTVAAVPEPATMLLLGTGLFGVAARAYKRRKS